MAIPRSLSKCHSLPTPLFFPEALRRAGFVGWPDLLGIGGRIQRNMHLYLSLEKGEDCSCLVWINRGGYISLGYGLGGLFK
jgi:hypothetical protein